VWDLASIRRPSADRICHPDGAVVPPILRDITSAVALNSEFTPQGNFQSVGFAWRSERKLNRLALRIEGSVGPI
jgi:hypothetical protein